jgi:hypothetical protein
MATRERLFNINEDNVMEILFADNSDDEDNLAIDDEDRGFLLEDVDHVSQEVVIERPASAVQLMQSHIPSSSSTNNPTTSSLAAASFYGARKRRAVNYSIGTATVASNDVADAACSVDAADAASHIEDDHSSQPSKVKKTRRATVTQDISFNWKRKPAKCNTEMKEYSYGKINLQFENTDDYDPLEVFEKVCNFKNLLSLIVQQSELYMKQNGIPFETDEDEMRAFLGICLVMGYHVLPSLRDYWSTQPDLHVPYIANTMIRSRFETIRSALHFSNNEDMLPITDPQYDRAFKVRPLINHFNDCFQSARNPTKQQAVDEHMVKFKGHNVMKQYIRNKPVKWGFKMWCRCDSVTGYLSI